MNPPPADQTAEWIKFGITTLLSVPSAVLGAWLVSEKLKERRPDSDAEFRRKELPRPTPAILNLHPAHGTSSANLALASGYAATQVVLDSMAEIFPYEFPPN